LQKLILLKVKSQQTTERQKGIGLDDFYKTTDRETRTLSLMIVVRRRRERHEHWACILLYDDGKKEIGYIYVIHYLALAGEVGLCAQILVVKSEGRD
jgi:hypothetical protein